MSLEELSAMYDPETMDFDEFVQTYKNNTNINTNTPTPSIREEQDLAYEQSLAQDRAKKITYINEIIKTPIPIPMEEDPPKPTLAELRILRLAKLAPVVVPVISVPEVVAKVEPDYTTLTVVELKRLCKEKGMKGFTGKCKQDLVTMLAPSLL